MCADVGMCLCTCIGVCIRIGMGVVCMFPSTHPPMAPPTTDCSKIGLGSVARLSFYAASSQRDGRPGQQGPKRVAHDGRPGQQGPKCVAQSLTWMASQRPNCCAQWSPKQDRPGGPNCCAQRCPNCCYHVHPGGAQTFQLPAPAPGAGPGQRRLPAPAPGAYPCTSSRRRASTDGTPAQGTGEAPSHQRLQRDFLKWAAFLIS